MDIFNLDYNMNGMAPHGMVAFHTPPHGIIPPHSAALVVIPNGTGDGLLQYGWFTGASSRILLQDSMLVDQKFRDGTLDPAIHEAVLRHLSAACGAENPEVYHQRCRIGAMILSCFQAVSVEERIFWLRCDLLLRRANVEGYYAPRKAQVEEMALESSLMDGGLVCELRALEELRVINEKQTAHVLDVLGQLLALLPPDRAAIVAAVCEIDVPLPQTRADVSPGLPQSQPTPAPSQGQSRRPLATVSANVQVPSPPTAQPKQDLKRKRPDAAPRKILEVLDLLPDSEDEDCPQSQVKATSIQAKIAAIRRRTAHEDYLVPTCSKKMKTAPKPASATGSSTHAAKRHGAGARLPTPAPKPVVRRYAAADTRQRPPPAAAIPAPKPAVRRSAVDPMRPPPSTTATPFQTDPYAPPRSSQNVIVK